MERYNARATHPVHVVSTLDVAALAEYDRPVGLGALISVDTTTAADLPAAAAALRNSCR